MNKSIRRGLIIATGVAVGAYAARQVYKAVKSRQGTDISQRLTEAVDFKAGWHTLATPLGLLSLVNMRQKLRKKNLYDTEAPGALLDAPPPPPNYRTERTMDGTYNDLEQPRMGAMNTRFGRNVPLGYTYPREELLMTPNPREVSLKLMTRDKFQPVPILNLLAGAWLQFMIRDWLAHDKAERATPFEIPLPPGDTWHENPMRIAPIMPDPTRTEAEAHLPPTHTNAETHWWDGSQIYGTSKEFQNLVRSRIDGKLLLDMHNNFSLPDDLLKAQGNASGWWIGMELLFTLFILEHNAICDKLKVTYPNWDDEALFQRARLVNAALMAKIHTIEWTPAILGHPVLQIAMRVNWWGAAGEQVYKLLGRISKNEVISGIMGGETDHFGVPYTLTEEFVSVYRMHPLVPDDYAFRSHRTDAVIAEYNFQQLAGLASNTVMARHECEDVYYSFGRMNPGAIVLHNFPKGLQTFTRPDGVIVDLAAHDILRSRELGVPRYNEFRRLMHLKPFDSIDQMTANPTWAAEIRELYNDDVELVDLTVGLFAEEFPHQFGFSDTAFRIFLLMASRRLNSDRFFTVDFRPEIYTPEGMAWVQNTNMSDILLRHYPALAPALAGVKNAFAPWNSVGNSVGNTVGNAAGQQKGEG